MKKIKIIQIIGFVLFFVYLGLFVADIVLGFAGEYREIVFSILLAIISINMLSKGVFLKSQSTLWFAITLVLYAIIMIVFSIYNIDYNLYNYIFILLPVISSAISIVVFHNLLYIKVIILNVTLVVPVILNKFIGVKWYWLLLIGILSVVLGIFVCRLLKVKREKI